MNEAQTARADVRAPRARRARRPTAPCDNA